MFHMAGGYGAHLPRWHRLHKRRSSAVTQTETVGMLLGMLGLLAGLLLVFELGTVASFNAIGQACFTVLIYGAASALNFGLFGPPNSAV